MNPFDFSQESNLEAPKLTEDPVEMCYVIKILHRYELISISKTLKYHKNGFKISNLLITIYYEPPQGRKLGNICF